MIVEFPTPRTNRPLTDDEMKAIGLMFWQANILARRTLAQWSLRKKKPSQDEMINLAATLHGAEATAEEIMTSPPGDGHRAINWMKVIVKQIEQLNPLPRCFMTELDPVMTKRVRPTFLKEWRKHRKLTLEVASRRAGMTAGNLSAMERGTQGTTQAGLEALAQAYECEAGQLLSTNPIWRDQNVTEERKQSRRPHFIPVWAERRNLIQTEIANLTGADKSVVSRWYSGATPSEEWQTKLAELFGCNRQSLFRHPDEDWLVNFFHNRTNDEVERMKRMPEAAFPPK